MDDMIYYSTPRGDTTMSTVTIPEPTEQDVELARSASSSLRARAETLLSAGAAGRLRVKVDADGDLIEMPGMVTRLLQTLLEHIAAGRGISIMPLSAELTTQQAADLLGVSRPFLIKLLEEGAIPHRKVGRHRRVRVAALLAYREANQAARSAALDELAAISEELGEYE
jgi:excisionase family DNA binding protein